jgi:hypothetical protein
MAPSKTKATIKKDKEKTPCWLRKPTMVVHCLPATNYTSLCDAAYRDFSQVGGEFKTNAVYLDCLGNPTIGVGHLIMPKSALNNAEQEELWRKNYLEMDLCDKNGKKLSDKQKTAQFDAILKAMKNKSFKTTGGVPNYVKSPDLGKLKESGIKKSFKKDYDYWYNRVKQKFPDFDKYPRSLQLSLTHCAFAGELRKIKNTGNFVNIAQQVLKIRNTNKASTKEREMARLATEQCKYLAKFGLGPNKTNSEKYLAYKGKTKNKNMAQVRNNKTNYRTINMMKNRKIRI